SPAESIVAVGLNHKTAPIQLREQLAFRNTSLTEVVQELRSRCGLNECAIISTCNRAEFYAVSTHDGAASLFDALARIRHVDRRELQSHSYEHHDTEAVWHLCRVASGLDSMVVGENQVLKQVKDASEAAVAAGTSGPILAALFRQAVT
ncbi:MAG: glutamyl-tRNA reductase, partial [Armatimonadota bacterium]|nr:glutamyl-tRNA reductase [Armatimonadota bacterium]